MIIAWITYLILQKWTKISKITFFKIQKKIKKILKTLAH